MAKFVVDFAKTGARPRPTGGWMRRHSTAITRRSGRRLPSFWTHKRATSSRSAAAPDSTLSPLRGARRNWPGGRAIFFRPISPASTRGAQHEGLANVRAPQRIDLTDPAWNWQAGETSGRPLAAILCINVLHISPWRVSQNLFSGAGRFLRCRRPFVRLWPVHARRRAHGAQQRSLRCHLAGGKPGMGRPGHSRSCRARRRSRPFTCRNHADAGK